MSSEEWRDVAGYEGIYQVSSFGRVKSLCCDGIARQAGGYRWKFAQLAQ